MRKGSRQGWSCRILFFKHRVQVSWYKLFQPPRKQPELDLPQQGNQQAPPAWYMLLRPSYVPRLQQWECGAIDTGHSNSLEGYGVKWPVRSCTPKLHVLVGHTASFGSNSPRRGTAAHCSASSADLYTGFQAVGAITTASEALLQSPVIESLASLFAINSPWHLLQHLALFSASHYQIFLTLISPAPLLFSQLRTTVSPSIHSLTAQQINRSQPLRYFHMGQTLLATRLPCPGLIPLQW